MCPRSPNSCRAPKSPQRNRASFSFLTVATWEDIDQRLEGSLWSVGVYGLSPPGMADLCLRDNSQIYHMPMSWLRLPSLFESNVVRWQSAHEKQRKLVPSVHRPESVISPLLNRRMRHHRLIRFWCVKG